MRLIIDIISLIHWKAAVDREVVAVSTLPAAAGSLGKSFLLSALPTMIELADWGHIHSIDRIEWGLHLGAIRGIPLV